MERGQDLPRQDLPGRELPGRELLGGEFVLSLERGLRVVEALGAAGREMTLTEVAEATGTGPSSE